MDVKFKDRPNIFRDIPVEVIFNSDVCLLSLWPL